MTRDAEETRPLTERWTLDQAQTRLEEIAGRAASHGPQRVELPNGDALLIQHEPARPALTSGRTGADLVAAMQACPYPDFAFGSELTARQTNDLIDHLLVSPPWDDEFADDVARRPNGPGRDVDL